MILRLILSAPREPDRTLEYGEVVDREGKRFVRFSSWQGLLPSVQDFVATKTDQDD